MKKITQISITALAMFIMAACGNSKKEGSALINDKKAAIEKLKSQNAKNDEEIQKLQAELEKLDTNAAEAAKIKLVAATAVTTQDFKHYIDLQGHVDAQNISYISPRGMPGQVKALYVQQGQYVKKGQLLLKLDDAIMQQQVTAARQQSEVLKTQLAFAKNVYQRQKNLWDQNIGTELQLISAKNNVDALENQLHGANEQTKVAVEQLKTANVYSDVNGVADIVAIRVGETFQGMTATGPQIKIVNKSNLKVVTNVPENYLTRISKGSAIEISIPDVNKKFNSSISLISQSIDPTMRGFVAEAKIPSDPALKPNQSAVVRIQDYAASNAIVIPVNTVQNDESAKYVYVLSKLSNGKSVAKKQSVVIGEVYGNNVEIKAGLKAGDQLITDGYQDVYDGQLISIQN
ncbi:MAG: efflux RND transporter periplasmic adaptor subunit [Ferruginibacter sp.]|nr:efflux RND transporter periplasmic adaptor subunit [Bacteroidota bacterium]MBX2917606.1 efflux RND transporter periplasmic adaptor subunit [Ferruginibacter sp.]MCB0708914.1 efflux RND transporter periplasmic adaptor subunit [Chitinophagaceae bacterium]